MAERASTRPKRWERIKEYFRGIRSEIKKVVWPTKKETYRYTAVVLVTCVLFAFFFWILDTAFLKLLEAVLNISM
ncbi:MAG TPA: preprotein translocase subunit SecE [Clostridiales bacterium]|jgi:preprotein translocase subunit SecE|nr:preprotein translocase subunit SecE [Clostridiales bacterium]